MNSLKGKAALVTGGGQGLGMAIVKELIDNGADIAIHYFSSREGAEEMKKYAESKGQRAICIQADLTKESGAAELIEKTVALFGRIDVLVNNSGDLVQRKTLEEIDMDFWKKVMDVNLSSMMLVSRSAVKHMRGGDSAAIVNLASLAGRKGGHPGSLVYSTAKGAVITWTRALSNELAPAGIRVNCVAPGLILGTRFHNTHTTKESADKTVEGIPLGRAGSPEDVARTVGFLATEYCGFISGATIDVNGGVYCA